MSFEGFCAHQGSTLDELVADNETSQEMYVPPCRHPHNGDRKEEAQGVHCMHYLCIEIKSGINCVFHPHHLSALETLARLSRTGALPATAPSEADHYPSDH